MINLASQACNCAETLIEQKAFSNHVSAIDAYLPILSLFHQAFSLTFKAYAQHEYRKLRQNNSLLDLFNLNLHLGFSKDETNAITILHKLSSYTKGFTWEIWETPQEIQIFCLDLLKTFKKLRYLAPLELQDEFNN